MGYLYDWLYMMTNYRSDFSSKRLES